MTMPHLFDRNEFRRTVKAMAVNAVCSNGVVDETNLDSLIAFVERQTEQRMIIAMLDSIESTDLADIMADYRKLKERGLAV